MPAPAPVSDPRHPMQLTVLAALLLPSASPQDQPVDVYWADRWNSLFHRFSDVDGDGKFQGTEEITKLVKPETVDRATQLRVRLEDGWPTAYWIRETQDLLIRAVDANGDGQFEAAEQTVFRDASDGDLIRQSLALAEDGAVWWSAGIVIAYPGTGLHRSIDLNGDGDALDAGESVQFFNGVDPFFALNDRGAAPVDTWNISEIAAAGNGVIGYATGDDHAAYRFEDLNDDGDLTDPAEAILFLNAAGARPDLPQNPDFESGLLPSLELKEPGWFAFLTNIGTGVEDGELVTYLGTATSYLEDDKYTNVDGEIVNFLIFRCVDGNGDRDANDAGEVTLFYDGSVTSGTPHKLLLMRSLAAVDGGPVYATEVLPYPALFPGPDGNTWLHRFEDLNGDGDASDAGEQQLGVFELQASPPSEAFPLAPMFGNQMTDPWDISVSAPDLFAPAFVLSSSGCSSGAGPAPASGGVGSGLGGSPFLFTLDHAVPASPAFWTFGASTTNWNGVPLPLDLGFLGFPGCLLQHDLLAQVALATDALGHAELSIVVPAAPGLVGTLIPTQWFVFGPGPVLQASQLGELRIK